MWKECAQCLGVAFLLSCLLPCSLAIDSCGPGVSTPGVTIPKGDIILEDGTPLEIFCVLSHSHRDAVDRTSSHLAFYHNDKPVPSEFVTIVNSTTIRLYVERPPPSKSMYYCKLRSSEDAKELFPVCLNSVVVAFKPQEVLNFECISRNWENLTCSWRQPLNYVKTTYTLRLRLPGRAGGRVNYICPGSLDVKENRCFWDLSTDPLYRQPYEYYYFTINGENVLGNISFPVIKFHHYSHVIPNSPLNLSLLNETYESVCMAWRVPTEMASFPPGIVHKVKYQSVWDTRDHWEEFNTNHLHVKSSMHVLNITGLKYANAHYDIKVYMKSAVAPIGNDKWSIPANLTVKTKPTVPGSAPKTDIGSFEVSGGLPHRDVYLYWQHIPEYLQNGDNFEYRVYRVDDNGREHLVTPHDSSKAYAMLKGIEFNSHKFVIVSANREGISRDKAVVYIPSRRDSPPEPLSFTKIAFKDLVYELSWKPPNPGNFTIESYTIFWCDNERDRPYQCTGFLNWTHVPKDTTVKKIKVLDNKIYQFAISANTKDASSGMVWASCTVIHDKVVGRMKNVWINSIGPTFIEVGWKLDCSDRVGMVTGFRIYFCPILSPYNLTCREPEMNTTVFGDPSTMHGKVTGLKPYTTYMVAVAVETKNGVGLQSDPLYNTTLEAAPEQPKEVTITDITNASMMVSWEPPAQINGVLRFYEVYYNDQKEKVELPCNQFLLTNLRSYNNYSVSVAACTVMCSKQSNPVIALTEIGDPDKMERPVVRFLNSSLVLVTWKPPAHTAGFLNSYEVMVDQEGDGFNTTQFFNVTSSETSSQVTIPDCKSEGATLMYKFFVRGVNVGPDNAKYRGPWSEPDVSNCYKQPVSPFVMIVIWVFGSLAVVALCLGMGYMSKRLWRHCKAMRDINIKLPPGLAHTSEKEKDQDCHMRVHGWPTMGDTRDIDNVRTSADEELLLAKKEDRHGRNPSGDSSGCSSGHESVSSSLTSGTHMSSDSGTEVDQRAASPDGDGVFPEPLAWECSLRQRNVSTRTDSGDPYVKMGSVSVVTRSTPNLSDLPEGLGARSSAGYISMPSSEEMSHHALEPPGYCRVGLDSSDPASVDRYRPVKDYVSLASMIDSSSNVALRPRESTSKAYVAVPPTYRDRSEQADQSYCRMGLHPGAKPAGSGYVTLSDAPQVSDIPVTGGYVPHARFVDKKDSSRKPDELYVQVFAPGAGDVSKSPTTSV